MDLSDLYFWLVFLTNHTSQDVIHLFRASNSKNISIIVKDFAFFNYHILNVI